VCLFNTLPRGESLQFVSAAREVRATVKRESGSGNGNRSEYVAGDNGNGSQGTCVCDGKIADRP